MSQPPQRQRQSIRGPDGRPRLALEYLPRRFTWSEAADRLGHMVKCVRASDAQWVRCVSGASRRAGVIEQPVFGRGVLQLFHFTAGLERKPQFPRADVPQDQSAEASEGYECGRVSVRGRRRDPSGSARLTFRFLLQRSQCPKAAGRSEHPVKCVRIWLAVSRAPHRQRISSAAPVGPRFTLDFLARRSMFAGGIWIWRS